MKSKLAFSLFLLSTFALLVSTLPAAVVLDVPEKTQTYNQWCWAGVSQAIFEYYGTFLTQTEIADFGTNGYNTWNYLYGSDSEDPYYRQGINLILDNWGLASTYGAYYMTQTEVYDRIDAGQPFVIRWGWDSGGGHFLAGHGYDGDDLYYMDPWFGEGYHIELYDWVVDGANHEWTHSLELTTASPPPPTSTPTLTPVGYKTVTPTPTPAPSPTVTPSPSVTPFIPSVLDEGFDDFHIGTRPTGWTFVNCNSNSDTYTTEGDHGKALPSLKLDATGDKVLTKTFSQPNSLYFWFRGQYVDTASALLVEEYYSSSWNQVTNISNLPTTGTTGGPFALSGSTVQLQFTYSKSLGDLSFDDVLVSAHTPTPTPSPAPKKRGGCKLPTPVTMSPEPPPTTPITTEPVPAPEPTAVPIEELLLADPGDYNGDGIADVAIFRPETGLWVIRDLSRFYFGGSDGLPVSGDYDGDGSTDVAVYRSGLWAIKDLSRAYLGMGGDVPLPGDYDGDGRADLAVYRPASGLWVVPGIMRAYFGRPTGRPIPGVYGGGGALYDIPIPGDYDGDGTVDLAVFLPEEGRWAVRGVSRFYLGVAGDIPVPGDYTGDGAADIAIFRPVGGLWVVRGLSRVYFGAEGDRPVPADYDGDLEDEVGIFREGTGLWAVKGLTRVYYGAAGEVPVTR